MTSPRFLGKSLNLESHAPQGASLRTGRLKYYMPYMDGSGLDVSWGRLSVIFFISWLLSVAEALARQTVYARMLA